MTTLLWAHIVLLAAIVALAVSFAWVEIMRDE